MFSTDPKKKHCADGFSNVSRLDKYEYEDFDNLRMITLHSRITSLGIQTFRYCRELTWIDVDKDNPAFSSEDGVLFDKNKSVLICCPARKIGGIYIVPPTVRRIEDFAFSGSRLHEIVLNEGLIEIGDCAFEGCSRLQNIQIPHTVKCLGHVAFQGCSGLKNFHIPASVSYIEFPALPDGIDTITVENDHQYLTVIDGVLFSKDMKTLFKYPAGKQVRQYTIPDKVQHISPHAFYSCPNLEMLHIPISVKTIGDFAFTGMTASQKIFMPEALLEAHKSKCNRYELGKAEYVAY